MAKKKYSYKFIKNYIESVGYIFLLSDSEYKNVKTPLKLRCPEGHEYTTQWGHFFHRKTRCQHNKKHSTEFVKKSFCEEGYKLLEEVYIDSVSKMRYECDLGHKHSMTWACWKSGSRCPECVKHPYNKIVREFTFRGYKVLSKESEYTTAKFKFKFKCPNGHISSMNWYNFKRGNKCGFCAPNFKKNIDEVRQAFNLRGYTLLSKEYINEKENLEFICPEGHKHCMTWSNFKKQQDCAKCNSNISKLSQKWLDHLDVKVREYKVELENTFYRVDGFDPKTNTVYEFLGDYWHGNPEVERFNSDKINKHSKKTFKTLHQEWLNKKKSLESLGFSVVYIWESDFLNL